MTMLFNSDKYFNIDGQKATSTEDIEKLKGLISRNIADGKLRSWGGAIIFILFGASFRNPFVAALSCIIVISLFLVISKQKKEWIKNLDYLTDIDPSSRDEVIELAQKHAQINEYLRITIAQRELLKADLIAMRTFDENQKAFAEANAERKKQRDERFRHYNLNGSA